MSHPIPAAALGQHIAVLGKTGSGKTWAVRSATERLIDEGARVCIIDPTGAWWGLKSSASGSRAGFPVVIFGGSHADLPLGQAHGEALAEIIGTSSTPAIIDTSQMKVGERTRFFADFADALVRKNRGPLHLVIDEAHLFAPQGKVSDPQSGAMLHAANNLVSLGRSRGLRIVLITQRPAKLHKDSLTQVETLVAMRLIAPQDRKAVEEWIKDNADEKTGREVISTLATLKTGQAWIWAPELGILERVTFPKIRTYDSSRAPSEDQPGSVVLAPIDREAIAAKLQTVAADAIANDPARLKARIRELEAAAAKGKPAPAQDVRAIEEKAFARGRAEGAHAAAERLKTMRAGIHKAIEAAFQTFANIPPIGRAMARGEGPTAVVASSMVRQVEAAFLHRPGAGVKIPRGEESVLRACLQFPAGLRREQLTVLTGYKRSSRDAYIQRLSDRGFVYLDGALIKATSAGRAALPDAEPLPTGSALRDHWLARLPAGERAILSGLIEAYPSEVSRDALIEKTGYKRSSRDAYIHRLAAKELVREHSRGMVIASEALFE